MGDKFWQPTTEMYSSLFEKPKMTQKLLSKPPFKYIFDIITATTGATSYADGLYSEQQKDPNYYQNKDQKIIYLKKIIDVTSLVLKEQIAAQPSKIVSGLQPENTNLFLQAVYRAAVSGQDSKAVVRRMFAKYEKIVQDGGAFDENAPANDTKEKEPPAQQEEKKKEDPPKEAPQKQAAPAPEQKQDKTPAATTKAGAKQPQAAAPEPPQQQPTKAPAPAADVKKPEQQDPPPPPANKEPVQNSLETETKKPIVERPTTASQRPPAIQSNVSTDDNKGKSSAGTKGVIMDSNQGDQQDEDENPSGPVVKQPVKNQEINAQDHGQFVQDALQDDNEGAVATQKQGGDGDGQGDDDQEAGGGGIKITRKIGKNKKTSDKGGSSSTATSNTGSSGKGDSGSGGSSNAGVGVDVQVLGNLVQAICQNANPLGQSLDFISDDIQSMNTEMQYWHDQYVKSKDQMATELQQTDETLQPLQDKLAEIDEQIRDMKSQIQNVQSQIIQNQSQIHTLLHSVVVSK